MLTRSLAILLAPWLPAAALILPMGTLFRVSALVAGTITTVLCAFALNDDRARFGAAVAAGWVALSALILPATMAETTISLTWGVLMFSWLAGPLSDRPQVSRAAAPTIRPEAHFDERQHLPRAA